MIPQYATYFWKMHELLRQLERMLEPKPQPATPTSDIRNAFAFSMPSQGPTTIDSLLAWLTKLEEAGAELSLPRTADRIGRIRSYIDQRVIKPLIDLHGDAKLTAEIRVLREAMEDDLSKRLIFFPEMEKVEKFYFKPMLFGNEVFRAFPDARNDIQNAGSCYSTDNDTACVLHCFRIAEHGLKGLAGQLWKRNSGQSRNEAIETASWGQIIGRLRKYVQDMNTSPRSDGQPSRKITQKERKRLLDFYSTALDSCAYFNQTRIDAAHVYRDGFKAPEALAIMTRVREFMQFLVKNGVELPPRLPEI